jgi:hypothetical protein
MIAQRVTGTFIHEYKNEFQLSKMYINIAHYATNRQVAGSVPDGVTGIFQ